MEETKTQFGNSSKQNTSTGTSPTQDDEDYEPDEQTTVTYLANSNDGNFNQTGARINRSQTVKNTNGNNNIGQKNNQSLTGQMDNSDTQGSEFLRNKSLKDSPDRLKYTNNDKKLPPNFAERVLELEMELENDCTSIDSINNLLYLYSQAVEYYNGMNNDRFQLYADRIQNFLLKPEVLKVMQCASANPDGYKKEMEEKKLIKQQQLNQMDQGEARKAHQAEQERKKKERVQKMAQNMEDIQIPASEGGSSGVNSPEVKIQQFLDDQELKIEQAQKELKKEMSQQTENFQKRLEERKRKMKQNKKSVNNSRMCMEQEETKNESQSLSGSLVKANYGQRPNTVKGANMKKFNMPNFDDDILINRDFNDISMIKGSTNFENTQYIEEISFNTDLHLIKKLQDPEIDKNLYNNGANNQNQFEKIFENLDQFEDGVRSQSDNDLEDEDDGAILQEQQEEYQESMQQIWKNCEEIMEKLQREKQEKIEKIIEEVTQEKFEKIAEVKASFDFMIKRLDQQKQKEKSEMKKKEKEEEVKLIQEQMEQLKKSKIEQVNNEYEEKKKELMGNTKETQIAQESKKLTINNHTRMFNNSRVSKQSYSSSHQKQQQITRLASSPFKNSKIYTQQKHLLLSLQKQLKSQLFIARLIPSITECHKPEQFKQHNDLQESGGKCNQNLRVLVRHTQDQLR
eukprot:403332085